MNDYTLASLAPGQDAMWSPVGDGASGALVLRHQSGDRFAKIVPTERRDELEAERDRIAWLASTGLPGSQVLDWRDEDDGCCLVTSTVPGVAAHAHPEAFRRSWPNICEAVRQLHTVPVHRCPFGRRLVSMMALARAAVAEERVHREFLPVKLQRTDPHDILDQLEEELPLRLEHEAAEAVVCHGDLCLPNIMIDPDVGEVTGLIDLGRLGLADPYADLALLLSNSRESWETELDADRAAAAFASHYGIALDPARLRFYLWLDPLTW